MLTTKMKPITISVFLMTVALSVSACGQDGDGSTMTGPVSEQNAAEVIDDTLCQMFRECDCATRADVSLDVICDQGLQQNAYDQMLTRAREAGLTFDGDCVRQKLDEYLARGCQTADPADPPPPLQVKCQIYHGTKAEGEDCEELSLLASDCAQGLACRGTCLPIDQVGSDYGDSCVDERGAAIPESCSESPISDFLGGVGCIEQRGYCAPWPRDGEPCASGECADGYWCADGTCAEQKSGGDGCTAPEECHSGECQGGACTTLPSQPGADCTVGCAGEALGCIQGTCTQLGGAGEPCVGEDSSGGECAEGFTCLWTSCENSPTAPGCEDCGGGEPCLVPVCYAPPPAACIDTNLGF